MRDTAPQGSDGPGRRTRLALAAAGLGSLAAGVGSYALCREVPPGVVAWTLPAAGSCSLLLPGVLASIPSGLHAFGFTLIHAAAGPLTPARILGCTGLWFTLNALWEAVCHPATPGRAVILQIAAAARFSAETAVCTFDAGDLFAAATGAALAAAFLFLAAARPARTLIHQPEERP